jgi:hypothetical protein
MAFWRTMSADAEKYSPKTVTGLPFDEIMRRAMKLKPGKAKKKSKPKKAK